jgi:hypothetical protein
VRVNLSSEAAAVCWALTARPKIVRLGRRLRVIPCRQAASTFPQYLGRGRLQRPGGGSPERSRLGTASGRLKHLATGRSTMRHPRLQTQVVEDLLDHRMLQDRGDDLEFDSEPALAATALEQADREVERLLSV